MSPRFPDTLRSCGRLAVVVATMCTGNFIRCVAAEVEAVRKQLLTGKYADAVKEAAAAEADEPRTEDWPLLRAEGLMSAGKYAEARDVIEIGRAHV